MKQRAAAKISVVTVLLVASLVIPLVHAAETSPLDLMARYILEGDLMGAIVVRLNAP